MRTTPNSSTPDLERYRLLDHGDGRRLESFGGIVLDRPAPQAAAPKRAPDLWPEAFARFTRDETGGSWKRFRHIEEPWLVTVDDIRFELALSPQGQVGLFPEQLANWRWLRDVVAMADRELSLLNAFGYTGGATVAAITAPTTHRVEACHLDGAKSAVAWARRNAELNGKSDAPVRWIVDDVMTFLQREVKRNRRYDGVILDPPAFGRGPDGRRWKLADDLPDLLKTAKELLSEKPLFLLFSCHDATLKAADIRGEIKRTFGAVRSLESLSLHIPGESGTALPAGLTMRILF